MSVLISFLLFCGTAAGIQQKSYLVRDTKPVVLNGPYLTAPGETSVTVAWKTDTPCHGKVVYGTGSDLNQVAEPDRHGLLPIGTVHSVRLTGLQPGQVYQYKVVSTRVVMLRGYWSEKGLSTESALAQFKTLDRMQERVSFGFITDTQHEDLKRLKDHLDAVKWAEIDFLVHGGDTVPALEREDQLFSSFLDPVTARLSGSKPLVFVRGNHDMRGAYARELYDYLPTGTGQFYYSFDAGPVHFIVLDTGEDKDDDSPVYADLNRTEPYREREFAWLKNHLETNERAANALFRVILLHSPTWGWVDEQNEKWTELANHAGIDLLICGHKHRLNHIQPGEEGNDFDLLIVGQDQVATVRADKSSIKAEVTDVKGEVLKAVTVKPRGR